MKILRIIARLNVGGPARHVVWLTEALDDEEFQSVLVAGTVPVGEENMEYFAREHGVKPLFIKQMSRELSPKDLVSLWKVFRVIQKEQPDIIHTHTAKAGTIGRIAGFLYRWLTFGTLFGRPRKLKLVHTYHGHIFHGYYGKVKTRFFLFVERTLARIATDRIVVITDQQKKEIGEVYGVGRPKRYRIIPLGIDIGFFSRKDAKRRSLRDELGVGDSTVVAGIVGRLTEIKNHALFLQAVKAFIDSPSAEKSVVFVVIGDGHMRKELEENAKGLGLGDRVVFLGNREDPDVFYAGLDLLALTSRNEGTPLSLIEAMASRVPVISTAVGGVTDLLGNTLEEKAGFVVCERGVAVEPGDPQAFARGLEFAVLSESVRENAADRAFAFVNKRYDKSRLVEDMRVLYRDLVAY